MLGIKWIQNYENDKDFIENIVTEYKSSENQSFPPIFGIIGLTCYTDDNFIDVFL